MSKLSWAVDIPLQLSVPDAGGGLKSYELLGVVQHQGDLAGGHYVAVCRDRATPGCWWRMDDELVVAVGPPTGSSCSAYMLFYKAIDSPMSTGRNEVTMGGRGLAAALGSTHNLFKPSGYNRSF